VSQLPAVVSLILIALSFDYVNGFRDAANSITPSVSTRALTPGQAVLWVALFNFVAVFGFGTAVATTIGNGLVQSHVVTNTVLFAALTGAIAWQLATWYLGLSASSSHALIGGYGGASIAKAGLGAIYLSSWTTVLSFILLAPLIALTLALGLMTLILWVFRWTPPTRVDRLFRRLQLVSAALYSLGHGTNDAQKTSGIIAGALYASGYVNTFYVPFWVLLIAHATIALGTLTGGWRMVHTAGSRITKLDPAGGFAAELAGSLTLFSASGVGVPVSTTHTVTGAIIGVGATRRLSAVHWGVAGQLLWTWLLTIPAAGAIGALAYWTARMFGAS
jgi:PiT family inorganic phosphate transporter